MYDNVVYIHTFTNPCWKIRPFMIETVFNFNEKHQVSDYVAKYDPYEVTNHLFLSQKDLSDILCKTFSIWFHSASGQL